MDALKKLRTPPAQRLGNLLLKYHDHYLEGAHAPDWRFKDFENHAIHADDDLGGGAAGKCREWLDKTRGYLNAGQWRKATYACGVLSHYFTDPIMPLHTARGPSGSQVHRPFAWSVFKAYDSIDQLAQASQSSAEFQFAADESWIGKAVLAVAQISNRHFSLLLKSYEISGATEPPEYGLTRESQESLATLFAMAIDGWAAVLTRIADEVTVELPSVSLAIPTALAAVDMPLAWLMRRFSEASTRRAVTSLLREHARKGAVVRHPAEEVQTVPGVNAATVVVESESQSVTADDLRLQAVENCMVSGNDTGADTVIADLGAPVFLSLAEARARMKGYSYSAPCELPDLSKENVLLRLGTVPVQSNSTNREHRPRNVIHSGSQLIESPSIGPKTAKRFERIGVRTIGEFVALSPDMLEAQLGTRWITAQLISDWQDQARLVCEVPELNGLYAQMLVAVGCRTAWQLRTANPNGLVAQLGQFCQTSEGQQILSMASLPTVDDTSRWIESARSHAREKAA